MKHFYKRIVKKLKKSNNYTLNISRNEENQKKLICLIYR